MAEPNLREFCFNCREQNRVLSLSNQIKGNRPEEPLIVSPQKSKKRKIRSQPSDRILELARPAFRPEQKLCPPLPQRPTKAALAYKATERILRLASPVGEYHETYRTPRYKVGRILLKYDNSFRMNHTRAPEEMLEPTMFPDSAKKAPSNKKKLRPRKSPKKLNPKKLNLKKLNPKKGITSSGTSSDKGDKGGTQVKSNKAK